MTKHYDDDDHHTAPWQSKCLILSLVCYARALIACVAASLPAIAGSRTAQGCPPAIQIDLPVCALDRLWDAGHLVAKVSAGVLCGRLPEPGTIPVSLDEWECSNKLGDVPLEATKPAKEKKNLFFW
jgi:hypothetical protein